MAHPTFREVVELIDMLDVDTSKQLGYPVHEDSAGILHSDSCPDKGETSRHVYPLERISRFEHTCLVENILATGGPWPTEYYALVALNAAVQAPSDNVNTEVERYLGMQTGVPQLRADITYQAATGSAELAEKKQKVLNRIETEAMLALGRIHDLKETITYPGKASAVWVLLADEFPNWGVYYELPPLARGLLVAGMHLNIHGNVISHVPREVADLVRSDRHIGVDADILPIEDGDTREVFATMSALWKGRASYHDTVTPEESPLRFPQGALEAARLVTRR